MLSDLSWLPSPPEGHREAIRALKKNALAVSDFDDIWRRLEAVAGYALDEVQLAQVARIVAALPPNAPGLPPSLKLGILGDGTLSLLGPAIVASALRRGLRVEIVEGQYGSAVKEALDEDSVMRRAELDMLLIACDRRSLGLDRLCLTSEAAAESVNAAFSLVQSIAENLRPAVKGAVLVQTVVPPLEPLFGSLDASYAGSPLAQVDALNHLIEAWSAESNTIVVDVARLAGSVGLQRWDDPQHWHGSKLPFAPQMIPIYGDFVSRTLGAIRGKSRKCLVLDLDNTLWGGVIGDDGLDGIVLGQGSAAGEAFLAIQKMALALRDRGIVLAICSKNELDAARLPFLDHSEMVLKKDHIAVFTANWVDKAANLKNIAETLSIGLDALVFLDDNPAEREQVRSELPMVAVPELPANPALYPRTLMAAGYFDAISYGDEDRKRAEDYQANAQRASLQAEATDLTSYLKSLAMVCALRPFDSVGRARIAQLINKSNQFNLTTRRYTEADVERIEADPHKHALQIRLADRFADNGMISVVIADKGDKAWTIDTWLMSCRVLGRRVEEAVLANLVVAARAAGAEKLIGHYIESSKNRMVSDHYKKLGFRYVEAFENGSVWELTLADYIEPDLPMRLDMGAAASRLLHGTAPRGQGVDNQVEAATLKR